MLDGLSMQWRLISKRHLKKMRGSEMRGEGISGVSGRYGHLLSNHDELQLIAPVHCSAKKGLLSSSLKSYIDGSTEL
jgi:hypothetical protein